MRFTSEDASDFSCGTLPTLDVRVWQKNGVVLHSFYQQRSTALPELSTALPELSIYATLTQEIIRRLVNCSESLSLGAKQTILNECAQKFVHSGYTNKESRILIVQGVIKYIKLLRLSKLDKKSTEYKPLYLSNEYKESERKMQKYLDKM